MERIITDPKIMVGKPVVKGTRISVYLVLNLIAHGKTTKQIIDDYPDLTQADIKACLEYAARHMQYEETRKLEA